MIDIALKGEFTLQRLDPKFVKSIIGHACIASKEDMAIADVSKGLHIVHGRGMIHRDIKPANIL